MIGKDPSMVPKYTSTREELSDGTKLSDCPYAPSDPRWSTWQKVFIQRQQADTESWNRAMDRADARIEAAGLRLGGPFGGTADPTGIFVSGGAGVPLNGGGRVIGGGFISIKWDPPPVNYLDNIAKQLFAPLVEPLKDAFDVLNDVVGVSFRQIDAFLASCKADQILKGIEPPEPPHLIRGKPAPRPKQAMCAKHGQPRGSCRACWR